MPHDITGLGFGLKLYTTAMSDGLALKSALEAAVQPNDIVPGVQTAR